MKIQVQVPDATWEEFKETADSLNLPAGHFLDMVLRRALDEENWDFSSIDVKPQGEWGRQKLGKGEYWTFDVKLGWRVNSSAPEKPVTKSHTDPDDPWK